MTRCNRNVRWSVGLAAALALALVGLAGAAGAKTPDGKTPAEEQVCDGLRGAEFGLCNAYCEAIDCDSRNRPTKACESLRDNYFELTGMTALPCDATCPDLPDPTCSEIGMIGSDEDGCDICLCPPEWGGPDCATCEAGFDFCGVCGGNNDCN